VTPAHIVPEWYFTPFYAILRACPNKLGGAIGMFAAILLLFFIPFLIDSRTTVRFVFAPYSLPHKVLFWLFVGVFLTLMFLGSRAAAEPYVHASKLFTVLYFAYFLIVLPACAYWADAMFNHKRPASAKVWQY
jgi:ubiquinol-cytochrome c reductase cytochrome b subunit